MSLETSEFKEVYQFLAGYERGASVFAACIFGSKSEIKKHLCEELPQAGKNWIWCILGSENNMGYRGLLKSVKDNKKIRVVLPFPEGNGVKFHNQEFSFSSTRDLDSIDMIMGQWGDFEDFRVGAFLARKGFIEKCLKKPMFQLGKFHPPEEFSEMIFSDPENRCFWKITKALN